MLRLSSGLGGLLELEFFYRNTFFGGVRSTRFIGGAKIVLAAHLLVVLPFDLLFVGLPSPAPDLLVAFPIPLLLSSLSSLTPPLSQVILCLEALAANTAGYQRLTLPGPCVHKYYLKMAIVEGMVRNISLFVFLIL